MSDKKKGQDMRLEFYGSGPVVRHIKILGNPKRTGAFRNLIDTLGRVMFVKHPQQINITDSTNGELIASTTT